MTRTPSHLRESRKLWKALMIGWQPGPEHLPLIDTLCVTYDRLCSIRRQIEQDGITVTTPTGFTRPSPLLREEHNAGLRLATLWKSLSLEATPPVISGELA